MKVSQTTYLALITMVATVGALWLTNRTVAPKEATWNDVVEESTRGNYRLISTDELAKLYQQEGTGLLLIDTRQDWEFRTGHISGAINFPMEPTKWARWRKAAELEKVLGPDKERALVFY
jgi:3-mercaptopyruvate sulfurtransferase SseA